MRFLIRDRRIYLYVAVVSYIASIYRPVSLIFICRAETNIGIITACIPTLIPLYRLLAGQRKDSKGGFTARTGDSNYWFLRFFKSVQSSGSRPTSRGPRTSKMKSTDKQEFAVHVEDEWVGIGQTIHDVTANIR